MLTAFCYLQTGMGIIHGIRKEVFDRAAILRRVKEMVVGKDIIDKCV